LRVVRIKTVEIETVRIKTFGTMKVDI